MLSYPQILKILDDRHVCYKLYHHKPVATKEDDANFPKMDGIIVKNLVLTNKDKDLVLFTLPIDERADLKGLSDFLKLKRFSFGKKSDLAFLGVPPGMVSPLSLLNDIGGNFTFVVSSSLSKDSLINCHPVKNNMSLDIRLGSILKLLDEFGHPCALFYDNEHAAA